MYAFPMNTTTANIEVKINAARNAVLQAASELKTIKSEIAFMRSDIPNATIEQMKALLEKNNQAEAKVTVLLKKYDRLVATAERAN